MVSHEIFSANKYENANYCWHFHIYKQRKFHAQLSWAWKRFYDLGAWILAGRTCRKIRFLTLWPHKLYSCKPLIALRRWFWHPFFMFRLRSLFCSILFAQRTYDVYTTSHQRRCNVMTLHRRWFDVVSTLRARWVVPYSVCCVLFFALCDHLTWGGES